MSRSLIAVILAVALAGAAFAATPPPDEAVSIQIAYPVAIDAPVADILEGYSAAFEAENPNVTVEPVFAGGYGDVKTMVQTTIDGGGDAPRRRKRRVALGK